MILIRIPIALIELLGQYCHGGGWTMKLLFAVAIVSLIASIGLPIRVYTGQRQGTARLCAVALLALAALAIAIGMVDRLTGLPGVEAAVSSASPEAREAVRSMGSSELRMVLVTGLVVATLPLVAGSALLIFSLPKRLSRLGGLLLALSTLVAVVVAALAQHELMQMEGALASVDPSQQALLSTLGQQSVTTMQWFGAGIGGPLAVAGAVLLLLSARKASHCDRG